MALANDMMQLYHETSDTLPFDPMERATIIDKADILMAKFLLKKDVPPEYKSMEQVAGEAMEDMKKRFPGELGLLEKQVVIVPQPRR